jgi:hypothetical protein
MRFWVPDRSGRPYRPHPPELAVGNNTSTIFSQAREKSYNRSRHALTDFSPVRQYDAPVSSIPQGLDFSPLPARQRAFSCPE